MIDMGKLEALTGWRNPTYKEQNDVGKYLENYYAANIRVANGIIIILAILEILFRLGLKNGRIFLDIVGIVFLGIAFKVLLDKNNEKRKISVFKNGNFKVLDGQVCEFKSHSESPGVYHANVISADGEKIDTSFLLRGEGLKIGSPVLVVYADPQTIKGGLIRAFTPYMLTNEGIKHRL